MARFLIDEDLPLSLSHSLRQKSHTAEHVIELGQRGVPESRVFAAPKSTKPSSYPGTRTSGTCCSFPWGSHGGIVVVRFPSATPSRVVVEAVAEALTTIEEAVFAGALMVVEPGRIRIRRPI